MTLSTVDAMGVPIRLGVGGPGCVIVMTYARGLSSQAIGRRHTRLRRAALPYTELLPETLDPTLLVRFINYVTQINEGARRSTTTGRRPVGKVLPGDARRHHRALILQQLVDGGARSRADLARETLLTRVTISDLVAELIDDGFLTELGTRPGTDRKSIV